jgi:hypothetical protein
VDYIVDASDSQFGMAMVMVAIMERLVVELAGMVLAF